MIAFRWIHSIVTYTRHYSDGNGGGAEDTKRINGKRVTKAFESLLGGGNLSRKFVCGKTFYGDF